MAKNYIWICWSKEWFPTQNNLFVTQFQTALEFSYKL